MAFQPRRPHDLLHQAPASRGVEPGTAGERIAALRSELRRDLPALVARHGAGSAVVKLTRRALVAPEADEVAKLKALRLAAFARMTASGDADLP